MAQSGAGGETQNRRGNHREDRSWQRRNRHNPLLPLSLRRYGKKVAEGVGFEPTVGLPQRLISSQVPLTTQPPFQPIDLQRFTTIFGNLLTRF